jgi:hydroxyacylglutathione hydrolase
VIIDRLTVGPFGTNCYILGDESNREGMVIDPGDDVKGILTRAGELKLNIKQIVLTHGHIDHIGALKPLKEATGAEISMHPADAKSLANRALGVLFGLFYPPAPPPDRLLNEGDTIQVGEVKLKVLHTPGHTPGGISLAGDGVVFTGDTLFKESIGRTDLPGGNHSEIIRSIRHKLLTLPDETVVYPGHGPETTIGTEREGNPFLV